MAVKVIESDDYLPEKREMKHVLSNEKALKETKKKRLIGGVSKNTLHMGEKRKDPEYRRKENKRRKLQRQAKKERRRSEIAKDSDPFNFV